MSSAESEAQSPGTATLICRVSKDGDSKTVRDQESAEKAVQGLSPVGDIQITVSASSIGIMPFRALNKSSIPHDRAMRHSCPVVGVFRRTVSGPLEGAKREGGLDGGAKREGGLDGGADGGGAETEGLEADTEVEESLEEAEVEVRWRRAGEAVP
jgi:hypothetical protein